MYDFSLLSVSFQSWVARFSLVIIFFLMCFSVSSLVSGLVLVLWLEYEGYLWGGRLKNWKGNNINCTYLFHLNLRVVVHSSSRRHSEQWKRWRTFCLCQTKHQLTWEMCPLQLNTPSQHYFTYFSHFKKCGVHLWMSSVFLNHFRKPFLSAATSEHNLQLSVRIAHLDSGMRISVSSLTWHHFYHSVRRRTHFSFQSFSVILQI